MDASAEALVAAAHPRGPFLKTHGRWIAVMIVGAIAAGLLLVFPIDSVEWLAVSLGAPFLALIVIAVVVFRVPRNLRAVWLAFFALQALTWIGDVIYNYQVYYLGLDPVLGWADVAWVASYLAGIVALALLIRKLHTGRDDEAWTDTLILFLAGAAFIAVFILGPSVGGETLTGDEIISVMYPLLDLLIMSGLVRLLFSNGRKNLSLVLAASSMALYSVADLLYNLNLLNENPWWPDTWMEALFMLAAACMAAAAVAPGAGSLATPIRSSNDATIGSRRVIWLAIGALSVPLLLLYALWEDSSFVITRTLSVILLLTTILALFRIRGLFLTVEEQSLLLAEQARTDALTGLPNRRTLDFHLNRLTSDNSRFAVAMLDIDRFKRYNDTHGHQAADALLRQVAVEWASVFAAPHFLARYGGEEFTAVIEGLDADAVRALLEKARQVMPEPETVSIGYAMWVPGEPVTETLRRADEAMYMAKRNGRNRVEESLTPAGR